MDHPADLATILKDNKLPVLVRMACSRRHEFKVGTSRVTASTFGNLLITAQYLEHYFMVNLLHEGKEIRFEITSINNLTDIRNRHGLTDRL